jgi:hypothetical protein
MKKFLLVAFALFSLASCDMVKPPYQTNNNGEIDTAKEDSVVVKVRKVLLEDYTGHTCGNCPKAAKVADEQKEIHKEKLIVMAVHAGGFAVPDLPEYPADYRTPEGNELDQFFGISGVGNPNGMINRIDYPTSGHVKGHTSWAGILAAELAKPMQAWLTIEPQYNTSNRKLDVTVKTEFITALSGDVKLAVFLVEDSVISDQKNYLANPTHVTTYVHRHMLRKSFSGSAFGELIAANPQPSETTVDKSYSTTVSSNYNDKHCYVVALIYNAATYEVIQAEEKKIK